MALYGLPYYQQSTQLYSNIRLGPQSNWRPNFHKLSFFCCEDNFAIPRRKRTSQLALCIRIIAPVLLKCLASAIW